MLRARYGEVAVVAGVDGVGRRVEEVTAQRGGEREHHRVARAEEVDGRVAAESALGGEHGLGHVVVAVLVHQGDDRTHGNRSRAVP